MASAAELVVRIKADTSDAQKGIDDVGGRASKMGGALKSAAIPAAAALAGIAVGAHKAVDAASATQQAYGSLDAIFGSNAAQMKRWAEGAATNTGLAASEYAEMASVIGAQLKNAGTPIDEIAGKTNDLITKGADMAAVFGGTTAEAVSALSSALKGETDPIERYGVAVKQADIEARKAADGTSELEGAAKKAADQQALLGLVSDQTADTVGKFAEESDSAAGSSQIASAQYENLMSTLGTILLPVVSTVADALGKLAGVMEDNSTVVQIVVGIIAALAAAIILANIAISVYTTVTTIAGIVSAASWAAALWPILLVVAAVAAVIAIIVILWKRSETFRSVVTGVWNGIKTAVGFVVDRVGDLISAIGNIRVPGFIKTAIDNIREAVEAAWDWVGRLINKIGNISVPGFIETAFSNIRGAIEAAWNWVGNLIGRIGNISVPGIIETTFNNIKDAIGNAWTKVGDLIGAIGRISVPGTIKTAIDNITTSIGWLIDKVESLIGWLGRIHVPKVNLPGPLSVTPAPEGASVARFAAPGVASTTASSSASARPISIVVNGALDPEATARQIRRILAGHDRRVGLVGA